MKIYVTTYIVEGVGMFPVDMLRYDESFPDSESDSAEIAIDGLTSDMVKPRMIKLRKKSLESIPQISIKRWESFGWRVLSKDTISVSTGGK